MRKILTPPGRMLALIARLAFPSLLRVDPGTSSMASTNSPHSRPSDARAPQTNREFADAAIRINRTLQ